MAMLAEPRRKQKLSSNPQGTNWSKDTSKFGQKLLERMGWSQGKGLGAKEDGRVDHVKIQFKGDQKGVGSSKSSVDNWIAHQDDFNSLLESLKEGATDGESDSKTVVSLEKKSQSSRSRVHYSRFTRGKDLSSRSQTDLNCIFGKRSDKSGESTPAGRSTDSSDEEKEDKGTESSHGFKTITNTRSMQDYFATKMSALQRMGVKVEQDKSEVNHINSVEKSSAGCSDTEVQTVGYEEQNSSPLEEEEVASEKCVFTENSPKKKVKKAKSKKKRKDKEMKDEGRENGFSAEQEENLQDSENCCKEKKKKPKRNAELDENLGNVIVCSEEESKKKKLCADKEENLRDSENCSKEKKKKKRSAEQNHNLQDSILCPKEKRKKTVEQDENLQDFVISSKKERKKKKSSADHEENLQDSITNSKKEKKKNSLSAGQEENLEDSVICSENEKEKNILNVEQEKLKDSEGCSKKTKRKKQKRQQDEGEAERVKSSNKIPRKEEQVTKSQKQPLPPVVEDACKTFRGSNMETIEGYSGIPSSNSVKRKQKRSRQRRK